jgi:hypothetical protein
MQYEEYISSEHWRARKTAYYRLHAKICAGCGSKDEIHLHHHTYKNFTQELDEDLVPLCETCHVAVHRYHRKFEYKSLTQATREVIAHVSGKPVDHLGGKRKRPHTHKKRSMSPSTKKRAKELTRAGHADPVNQTLAEIRERRRKVRKGEPWPPSTNAVMPGEG